MPSPRKLITATHVDEIFNWSRWTRIRLEKKGRFPRHVKVTPGRVDYFEDEIIAFQKQLASDREIAAA
jgi:predicted DNA-binding transcriptional regulator AlpA